MSIIAKIIDQVQIKVALGTVYMFVGGGTFTILELCPFITLSASGGIISVLWTHLSVFFCKGLALLNYNFINLIRKLKTLAPIGVNEEVNRAVQFLYWKYVSKVSLGILKVTCDLVSRKIKQQRSLFSQCCSQPIGTLSHLFESQHIKEPYLGKITTSLRALSPAQWIIY